MKVVSVRAEPRYYSYAGSAPGGRTLRPGDESPDLSLEKIFHPILLRDLEAGNIQIRLSDDDRRQLERMLAEDSKPIRVKSLPAQPPKPVRRGKKRARPQAKNTAPKPPAPRKREAKPKADESDSLDLSKLRAENEELSGRTEISRFMGGPLESRV